MLTNTDYMLVYTKMLNKLQKVNVTLSALFDLTVHLGFNNKYRKNSNHLLNTHTHTHKQLSGQIKNKKI